MAYKKIELSWCDKKAKRKIGEYRLLRDKLVEENRSESRLEKLGR